MRRKSDQNVGNTKPFIGIRDTIPLVTMQLRTLLPYFLIGVVFVLVIISSPVDSQVAIHEYTTSTIGVTVTQTSTQESSPLGIVEGIIIGVVVSAVGAILQFILAKKEDQRHSRELHQEQQQRIQREHRQKREKAYVKIYAIFERFKVNASTTRIVTNEANFKDLQAAVEDNYEVLDQSTIEAWRQKKLTIVMFEYTLEAGLFFGNVKTHYERFDKRNPYYSHRDEDIESTGFDCGTNQPSAVSSPSESDEPRRLLEEIREEQVSSSFDTVLLLLLPITTFLLAFTSTRTLPPILSALFLTLALWFCGVLVYFIYGKLVGNYKKRATAWFVFFIGFIAVTFFAVSFWIASAVTIAPLYLFYYFIGCIIIGTSLSLRPVRWMKRTMEQRLPMRAAEIQQAYELISKLSWPVPYFDFVILLAGVGALLFSVGNGLSNIPSSWLTPIDAIAVVCFLPYLVVVSWSMHKRRKSA